MARVLKLPSNRRGRALLGLAAGLLLLLAGLRLAPHAGLRARLGESLQLQARDGQLLRLTLAPDQQYRAWVPLAAIAPVQVEATLLYEDRGFWWHAGVSPTALARSLWHMARGGRREGGSTVTMQLARRLYGIDSRSAGGKLRQIAAALWLEARHGKREILEAYLNTVPCGGNVEGLGTASLVYFHHDAATLRLPEALTLAVIPQHPGQRLARRAGAADAANPALEAARARLWAQWRARHPQDAVQGGAEAGLRVPALDRTALPFAAPHLVDQLTAQVAAGVPGLREPDGRVRTTLDLRMQRTLERVVAGWLRNGSGRGLRNASALLLDASTMEVRALVGSADHGNDEIAGQVNGMQAKRSPGSTLKPFIYGLALDQGLLHPRTVLKDAPTSFGPFTPENFDGQFQGPLSAQEALTRSRNIPAVAVAARLTQPSFYQFLQQAQVSRLARESHYGLALVLGGGEVTGEELARLYALLANGGVLRPLAYTAAQARAQADALRQQPPPALLSPEAAWVVLDMLRQTPRPDTGVAAQPPVAWKTGTSWGFRDAWTAGVFGRHVLVVWVGEFDGRSNPAFIGIEAAAPLYLRIVDALRAQGLDPGELARPMPAGLQKVEVCTATGGLPDALCPARSSTWFLTGKSPVSGSGLHREVWLDGATGARLCGPGAASVPGARRLVVEQWGSDLQRLFRQGGLPRRRVTACPEDAGVEAAAATGGPAGAQALSADAGGREAPQITAPLRGVQYLLDARHPQPLALRADAAAGVAQLTWFADDALLGRTRPGEALAWLPPRPGDYSLRVVDEQGRVDVRALHVGLRE